MRLYLLVMTGLLIYCLPWNGVRGADQTVRFPAISSCQAMTMGPMEHLFASYYGINSWDATQR